MTSKNLEKGIEIQLKRAVNAIYLKYDTDKSGHL
jgi:hypothetical protein